MDLDKHMTTPTAFVIMPFAAPIGDYYKAIYKPALEAAGLQVTRGDDFFNPRPILDDIRASVASSDLLLADLTGRNPNVFYELGLAHAIGKSVILTSQRVDDIPFDLRHVRVIEYNLHDPVWAQSLRTAVERSARSALLERSPWPLPLVQAPATRDLPPTLTGISGKKMQSVIHRQPYGFSRRQGFRSLRPSAIDSFPLSNRRWLAALPCRLFSMTVCKPKLSQRDRSTTFR